MKREKAKYKSYKGWIMNPQLRDFHEGRIWLKEYTSFTKMEIKRAIQHNYFQVIEGIQQQPSLKCMRCYNDNLQQFTYFDCSKCQKICVYCRHCLNMGRISCCTKLLVWRGPKVCKQRRHSFEWTGRFTPLQQQAAEEMLESVKRKRSHLINAVCGAGKTEILFQSVHYALEKGLRVCIATPRTDVVLELFPRFQSVFPNTNIHALYGGAPKQAGYAQLIMATTHQLYRFQQAFDLIIVDEADAFPYTFDKTLQTAVQIAKKQEAPIVFVTATPSQKLLQQYKKDGYSFIPKRYHNHPLPVPRYSSLWSYENKFKKGKIPIKLLRWTEERLARQEPFLIFLPKVALMDVVTPLFQAIHPDILAVHAEDPERKEKVLKLRNEEIPGLLTTTILERGITIKNVQVAVVGAESAIFTASALIQIAGRVGRNQAYADGDVVFFHHGITVEMDEAKATILHSNKEGFST
ncbi:DEAD/DEAH box helicase [Lysinibacillus sp. NPDC097287]|uniref:DEAD/DEAH box helicase n=1 Tax=Lysinibacillus sp. NPDC097287 TaxID=3364144 RepID=UPI0037FDA9B8